ncbi:zinc finger protein 184-like isoform X2 [Bradysia coprophila]|uniref:zinc finger protein 184-like isoform X2 n=1 Tax=Bradysia coprophila TaxID=38358 RepID=UPI00187DD199|nr:zinc finger protein 184-like isoform X2 [Bradysia coprophila]
MSQLCLYNSTICRLCGERSQNGMKLFTSDEHDISHLINRYLPLKIVDDRQYPRWICPGCHLQVESTVEFFDLVMKGQESLRCAHAEESKSNVDHLKKDNLYSDDHVIYSRFGLPEKEKRKRGRPSKATVDKIKEQEAQTLEAAKIEQLAKEERESQELMEENTAGRRKRKIKLPSRFQEVVQGRELERVYVENGVIDKLDNVSDNEGFTNEADVNSEGVIGHMEDADGLHVVDLIFDSTKTGKKHANSGQRKKFICEICSRSYTQQLRYMSHKMSHRNVQYECIQCLEKFSSRKLISEHQEATTHTGEGIIENIETESNDEDNLLPDTVFGQADHFVDDTNAKTVQTLDDVFDEMDNIEETAAKVLYGLQNMDRTESPQSFSMPVTQSVKEINSEFLTYTNFITEKEGTSDEKTTTKPTSKDSLTARKRHDCSICNKSFANESLLTVHYQLIHAVTHSGQPNSTDNTNDTPNYPCDKCNRTFKNPSSMLYHKNSEHNHFRFVCSKCGKSFKHKQLLRRHQLVHSQDRPYSCTTCGASFKTKPNLLNHMPIHNSIKNHNCDICNQSFAHKTSLKLHLLWHAGTKPFSCEVCGKSFSQNGNLQEHIRIHTNVRPFSCQYCDKTFKTSSQCQIHSKRHNVNVKPYSCHLCSKSFLQHDILKTHLRRHNNEKPFSCTYCDKAFSEHWALIKHCRTHTKEKPYKCTLCPKTFADCSNLAKHKKTHQNKIPSTNNTKDKPSTPETASTSNLQNKDLPFEKSVHAKSNDLPEEENLFDPIVLADIVPTELSDSVWRLADQNDIDKDNQIFYVTYQDPNLGQNKTVKLVNQVNSSSQLDSSSEIRFTQGNTSENVDELRIPFVDDDNNVHDGIQQYSTSNLRLLTDQSENVALERKNLAVNDQNEFFNMDSEGLEIITSDGKKLRFLQTIQ